MPVPPAEGRGGEPWREAHRRAVAAGGAVYRDPVTGHSVMTELAHRARGSCCGSGCRHCPWDHAAVDPELRRGLDPPVIVSGG